MGVAMIRSCVSYPVLLAVRDSQMQLAPDKYYGTAQSLAAGRRSAKLATANRQAAERALKKLKGARR